MKRKINYLKKINSLNRSTYISHYLNYNIYTNLNNYHLKLYRLNSNIRINYLKRKKFLKYFFTINMFQINILLLKGNNLIPSNVYLRNINNKFFNIPIVNTGRKYLFYSNWTELNPRIESKNQLKLIKHNKFLYITSWFNTLEVSIIYTEVLNTLFLISVLKVLSLYRLLINLTCVSINSINYNL